MRPPQKPKNNVQPWGPCPQSEFFFFYYVIYILIITIAFYYGKYINILYAGVAHLYTLHSTKSGS